MTCCVRRYNYEQMAKAKGTGGLASEMDKKGGPSDIAFLYAKPPGTEMVGREEDERVMGLVGERCEGGGADDDDGWLVLWVVPVGRPWRPQG